MTETTMQSNRWGTQYFRDTCKMKQNEQKHGDKVGQRKYCLLTTIEILVHSFQPAHIIVSVRHKMNIDVTVLTSVTCLQQNDSVYLNWRALGSKQKLSHKCE